MALSAVTVVYNIITKLYFAKQVEVLIDLF